jgi:hypothetical protein
LLIGQSVGQLVSQPIIWFVGNWRARTHARAHTHTHTQWQIISREIKTNTISKSWELTTFKIRFFPLFYACLVGVKKNSTKLKQSCMVIRGDGHSDIAQNTQSHFLGPKYVSGCQILNKIINT